MIKKYDKNNQSRNSVYKSRIRQIAAVAAVEQIFEEKICNWNVISTRLLPFDFRMCVCVHTSV